VVVQRLKYSMNGDHGAVSIRDMEMTKKIEEQDFRSVHIREMVEVPVGPNRDGVGS
jgi:hypothetical protein